MSFENIDYLKDNWHYHRWGLAYRYLKSLQTGTSASIALYCEPSQGATDFLIKDISPLALKMGATVVYIDFKSNFENPACQLIQGFENAIGKDIVYDYLRKENLQFSLATQNRSFAPYVVHACFEALCSLQSYSIMLLDEIPYLTIDHKNQTFIRSLRSHIQRHSDLIAPVFFGSNQILMNSLLSNQHAPFYQAARMQELPALGDEFVFHTLSNARKTFNLKVDADDAIKTFEKLSFQPAPFLRLIMLNSQKPDSSLLYLLNKNKGQF